MFDTPAKFARLIRWEWRLATAERSYGMTMTILVALTLLAFGAGFSWSRERGAVIDQIRAKEAENLKFMRSAFSDQEDFEKIAGRPLDPHEKAQARILRIIADTPTSLAYTGAPWSALLPPSTLSPLSIGHSDLRPDRFKITAWSKRANLEREDIVNPFHLATGPFDPASLAVALLPLVLIVMAHDLISSDRERGILALTLSQPTSLFRIVLARLLVRVAVPTATVVGVTGLGLVAGGADPLDPGTATRFALWAALVLMYGALWGGLALAVNSSGGSSVANAILLAACWIGMVVVIPSAIGKGAALASPVPPRSELITLEREVRAEAERNGNELLDRYYLDHPELTRPDKKDDPYGQTRWDAIALEVDRKMQPASERHRDLLAGQLRFSGRWQVFSPALAAKAAMDDLAGTSLAHHVELTRLAERYHTEFMDYLRPKMMTRYDLGPGDFERLPRYAGYSLGERFHPSPIRRAFLILGAWSAALYLVAILRIRRPIAAS